MSRRGHEALDEGRAQNRVVRGERHGESQRVRVRVARDEAPGVGLAEATAGHDVLDARAAGAGPGVRRPNIARRAGSVNGTSSSLKRAISSTRSISRVTSRARQVGTVTRQLVAFAGDLEAEPLEDAALLGRGRSRARRRASVRAGRRRVTGPDGSSAPTSAWPDPASAGVSTSSWRREHRRLPGEVRVDALLPAVRGLAAQAEPLGRAQDADRLEVRRLEQDVGRRLGDLGLEAAHDPGDGNGPERRP